MDDEIAAWLRAQAEADLARAQAATPGEWAALDGGVMSIEDETQWPVSITQSRRDRADRVHIAAHDPRTEVARAESVLAVLDAYETGRKLAEAAWEQDGDWVRGLRRAVRLLAYGYRHREGYEEGWKP